MSNGSWFDYVVDRISRQNFSALAPKYLASLSFVISDVADRAARKGRLRDAWGSFSGLQSASDAAVKALYELGKKDPALYRQSISRVLKDSESICWLVDYFLSGELRRHAGRSTDLPKFLSADELESSKKILLQRLSKQPDRDRLFEAASLASPLFQWSEMDDNNFAGPCKWFAEHMKSDADFLELLEKMRGRSVSDRVHHPLSRDNLEPFTDWEALLTRLQAIANDPTSSKADSDKAKELWAASRERS